MILRNYFYLCIDRLDWIPNLKKNFSFFLLHLRIIGNFFKFFSILNPRTKQLSENYFSWTLYLKQRFIIRRSFSAQIHLFIEKRRVFTSRWCLFQNYSNHLCFSQSNLRYHLLVSSPLVVDRFIGEKDSSQRERKKGMKREKGEGKNNHTGQSVVPLTVEKWIPTFTNRSWSRCNLIGGSRIILTGTE